MRLYQIISNTLQVFLVVTCLLVFCPFLAAAAFSRESIELREGETGTMRFHHHWPTCMDHHCLPSYTIQFLSIKIPFCIQGRIYQQGLKVSDQLQRFEVREDSVTNHSISVNLTISNVSTSDTGEYIFKLLIYGPNEIISMNKQISVFSPHGKAQCSKDYPYEIQCQATIGSVFPILSCFQNNGTLPSKNVSIDGNKVRSIFTVRANSSPVHCCAHISLGIAQETCNDSKLSPSQSPRTTPRHPISTVYSKDDSTVMNEITPIVASGSGHHWTVFWPVYIAIPLLTTLEV